MMFLEITAIVCGVMVFFDMLLSCDEYYLLCIRTTFRLLVAWHGTRAKMCDVHERACALSCSLL
jgi:hypothetical protein